MKIKLTDEIRNQFPYLSQYVDKYGDEELISTFEIPPRFKNTEEMYKYCLEHEKKWQEIVELPKGEKYVL